MVDQLVPVRAEGSSPAPFGLRFGTSLAELAVKRDLGGDKYIIEPPSPHPTFSGYLVQCSRRYGVVWVKGISETCDNDKFGHQTMALVDKIAAQLTGKYGPGKKTDLLLSGSIWNEPQDWSSGLSAKERFYSVLWDRGSRAQLPTGIESIYVGAVSQDSSSANVHIEYASSAMKAAEGDREADEADLL